jgi:hypothetical protein
MPMISPYDLCQGRIPVPPEGILHGSDLDIWMSMSMNVLHYGISLQRPVAALNNPWIVLVVNGRLLVGFKDDDVDEVSL